MKATCCVLFVFAVYIAATVFVNPEKTDGTLKEEKISQNTKIEKNNPESTPRTHTIQASIQYFDWQTFNKRFGYILIPFIIAWSIGMIYTQFRHFILLFIAGGIVMTCVFMYISHGAIDIRIFLNIFWNNIAKLYEFLGILRSLTVFAGLLCGAKCVSDHKLDKKRIVIQ